MVPGLCPPPLPLGLCCFKRILMLVRGNERIFRRKKASKACEPLDADVAVFFLINQLLLCDTYYLLRPKTRKRWRLCKVQNHEPASLRYIRVCSVLVVLGISWLCSEGANVPTSRVCRNRSASADLCLTRRDGTGRARLLTCAEGEHARCNVTQRARAPKTGGRGKGAWPCVF